MAAVSSKEFATNQDEYFDLALSEQVTIQRGDNMFAVVNDRKRKYKKPDDDLRRAITGDELLKRIYNDIDKKFASRIYK
jgi:hypothetical protein